MFCNNSSRELILSHTASYPRLEVEDLLKLLYQSAFGCEHLVSSYGAALSRIKEEYESGARASETVTSLGGDFCRVSLGILDTGLSFETFTRLFVLSAEEKGGGKTALLSGISAARELAGEGAFSFSLSELDEALASWAESGYPAVRHSERYRESYLPSYRVIAKRYIPILPFLARIDGALGNSERTVLAIEGGSASGKSTLSQLLARLYGASVIHADDFFLRPEQRTPERLCEVGGNLDRERLLSEALLPLSRGEAFSYRPYDCSLGALSEPVKIEKAPLTVVEGAYTMHPELRKLYDLSVFLEVSSELQRVRILKRNSQGIAERYFAEWIPLENRYFAEMNVKDSCSLSLSTE